MDELRPRRVVALGSPAVVPDSVLETAAGGLQVGRLGGGDRFGTAAAIASREFPADAPVVYLARGDVYADAVAAGALRDGPLLLVNTCALPAAARERIAYARPAKVVALGSASVVCDDVLQAAVKARTASGGRILAVDHDETGWSHTDSPEAGALSGDGRFAVFRADAAAVLPPGQVPPGATDSIFLRDRQTGRVELVSITSSGRPFGPKGSYSHAQVISVSDDGRFVAFVTRAPDAGLGDTNDVDDVYLRDRQEGTTRLVSAAPGAGAVGGSWGEVSADGRSVFFYSYAPLTAGESGWVSDVFRYSTGDGSLSRISTTADGESGNDSSYGPSASADGRYVAFYSRASNLVPGDTNGVSDVFVKDIETGAVVRVSVTRDGQQGDAVSIVPSISADGSRVAFSSNARTFGATSGWAQQVYLWDRQTRALSWVSRTPAGTAFNQPEFPELSADGGTVVFDALTGPGYQNDVCHVWRHDVGGGATSLISTGFSGDPRLGCYSVVSGDGSRVMFRGPSVSAASGNATVVWEALSSAER